MSLAFILTAIICVGFYLFNEYKLRYGIRYYVYKIEGIYFVKILGYWGRDITPIRLKSGFKELTLLYEELDNYVISKKINWIGYKDFQRKYDDYFYKHLQKRILKNDFS